VEVLIAVLFVLAVHRVSRLIVADSFPPIAWLRNKITGNLRTEHWAVYLLGNDKQYGCPWCASLWVGGIGATVLGLTTHWFVWQMWVMLALAASTLTGFIAEREKE